MGSLQESPIVAGFVGKNAKQKMKNMPIFSVEEHGKGQIIYLLESPIFRGFWYGGKLLFANSVFLVK